MPPHPSIQPQVLIFGGGASGLWLANELGSAGVSFVLVEAGALGAGQTIASQGIMHGGAKYALSRFYDRSAYAIRDMPALWRRCLAGDPPAGRPDLRQTRIRAEHCHLWRTESSSSRLAQLGARLFLRTSLRRLDQSDWPQPLRNCPGAVYQLDEQVIEPRSFLEALAAPVSQHLLSCDVESMEIEAGVAGSAAPRSTTQRVVVRAPGGSRSLEIRPETIVLAAGAGNGPLRERFGLPADAMQTRPLHMVMARGAVGGLPELNGHCVDGRSTRVTITADRDAAGRAIWQVGGQIAERGVGMSELELIRHARDELAAVVPGVDLSRVEWATYSSSRAEGRTSLGRRPEGPVVLRDGDIITCWPTKLVLVPELVSMVRRILEVTPAADSSIADTLTDWPRPKVAPPPWETASSWTRIP